MKLEEIDEQIEQLADEYFRMQRAESRLLDIDTLLLRLYADLDQHKLKMDMEHKDVVDLEKMSTLYLFAHILGRRDEMLERERQEYLQAVLEYNAIAHEIELLEYEQDVLASALTVKDDIKQKRDYYLKLKEQKILFHNKVDTAEIRRMNGEIDRLRIFVRELREAHIVAVEVETIIQDALRNLALVERFGEQEMFGAGRNSAYAKKKYIDKAMKEIVRINYLLNKLDKELSDVYTQYVFLTIYKYQNFIDSFYDQLITDWVLRSKLKNALGSLHIALSQVHRILRTLDNDLAKSDKKITQIIEEKRLYILKH